MKNIHHLYATALGILLCVNGCGSDNSDAPPKKVIERRPPVSGDFAAPELEESIAGLVKAIGKTTPKELQLNVELKGLTGYFYPVAVGANRAMSELDVIGAVEAQDETTGDAATAKQIAMTQDKIDQGTDGLGISPFGDDLADTIDTAVDTGIPVVTIDGDVATSNRDFYIGTMNAEAGETGANSLKDLLKSKGTVIVLGHDDPGWAGGYARTMGAKSVLEAAGFTVIVRRTDWDTGGDVKDNDFLTNAITTADPPVVGMIGMFSDAFRCATAAESVGKKPGEIKIVAFDFEPDTVSYMRSGMIQVTHTQRQYYMGYMTPYILYGMNVLSGSKVRSLLGASLVDAHSINTGLDVVNADKLDAYYAFLDDLGVSGS